MDKERGLNFIKRLAINSGEIVRHYYGRNNYAIDIKADSSPVTDADKAVEEFLRRSIEKEFPGHGIIAEEFGNQNETAEYVWVLDPIDGTKSFITGVPLFGTLIGLLHNGEPILGCIHQPILGDLCLGDNQRATLNGKVVRVREKRSLSDATLLCSDFLDPNRHQNPKGWAKLTNSVKLLRTWGDCYGYLLVACGRADIITDAILCPWDILPVMPIMRGAGAKVTGWDGHSDPGKALCAVAACPALHEEAIKALSASV